MTRFASSAQRHMEVLSKFEVFITETANRIRREPCVLMAPTVEDDDVRRVQLPVTIPVAPRSRKREVIVLSMGGRTALYPPLFFSITWFGHAVMRFNIRWYS